MSAGGAATVVSVPAGLVGRVIGKSGCIIQRLEAEFGCSVVVGKALG